jgi:hypothetical protein
LARLKSSTFDEIFKFGSIDDRMYEDVVVVIAFDVLEILRKKKREFEVIKRFFVVFTRRFPRRGSMSTDKKAEDSPSLRKPVKISTIFVIFAQPLAAFCFFLSVVEVSFFG